MPLKTARAWSRGLDGVVWRHTDVLRSSTWSWSPTVRRITPGNCCNRARLGRLSDNDEPAVAHTGERRRDWRRHQEVGGCGESAQRRGPIRPPMTGNVETFVLACSDREARSVSWASAVPLLVRKALRPRCPSGSAIGLMRWGDNGRLRRRGTTMSTASMQTRDLRRDAK